VLEDAVNFDLPVFADEMVGVRRHDLNLVTDVSKLSRRGHSVIGIDAEIWRVLWHPDLSIDRERIQNQKKLLAIPSGIHSDHRNQRNFVSERISDTDPGHLVVFTPLASGGNAGSVCFEKVLYVRHP
jgi:hypothetical protein